MPSSMHTMLTMVLAGCGAPMLDGLVDDGFDTLDVPADPADHPRGPRDAPRSVGVVVASTFTVASAEPGSAEDDTDALDPVDTLPNDTGLVGSPPSCTILAPLQGAVLPGGVPSHFEAAVDDVDGDVATVIWSSDRWGAMVIGLSFSFILPPGPHVVTLDVTDDAGHHCTRAIDLVVDPR